MHGRDLKQAGIPPRPKMRGLIWGEADLRGAVFNSKRLEGQRPERRPISRMLVAFLPHASDGGDLRGPVLRYAKLICRPLHQCRD